MATTKIWAVHDNLKRVIDYATNPTKTKNPDYGDYEFKGIDDTINVETGEVKIEKQFYVSGLNCHPNNVYEHMLQTKANAHKEDGVLAFHCYQSFNYGEVTPEIAHQIGTELAEEMWGDDFEVIVSTHLDKGHFHNHFVVNSVSWTTKKRFLNKHKDYAKFRSLSDEICKKYSLSVIKNPKKGKHYSEWIAEKQGIPTRRSLIKDDVDRAILQSRTFTQFINNLKSNGYEVKTNVKHIAIKPPGANKYFRLHKITNDESYSEDNIKYRILNNKIFTRDIDNLKPTIKKFKYHGSFNKTKKLTGFKALYFHYMYYMGIIPKHVPSKVHVLLKEDLRYMDKITKETTLLCKKKISTIADLDFHENESKTNLENLIKERRCIYNKIRRCRNPEFKEKLKIDVANLSKEIKTLRKEVMSYESIRKRSITMSNKLNEIKKERKEQEQENERRRRNSRSGHSDVITGN